MMLVRPLRADDRDPWAALFRGYLAFYKTTLPDEQVQRTFNRLLDPLLPMWALAAEDSNAQITGIVHCIEHASCWTDGPYCYLQDLFVAPKARGSGVGRALIEVVYREAEQRGCARVYWLTQEDNATARQLYDRIANRSGFIQYRRDLT